MLSGRRRRSTASCATRRYAKGDAGGITVSSVPAGMPAPGRCSGPVKLGTAKARKRAPEAKRSDDVTVGQHCLMPGACKRDRKVKRKRSGGRSRSTLQTARNLADMGRAQLRGLCVPETRNSSLGSGKPTTAPTAPTRGEQRATLHGPCRAVLTAVGVPSPAVDIFAAQPGFSDRIEFSARTPGPHRERAQLGALARVLSASSTRSRSASTDGSSTTRPRSSNTIESARTELVAGDTDHLVGSRGTEVDAVGALERVVVAALERPLVGAEDAAAVVVEVAAGRADDQGPAANTPRPTPTLSASSPSFAAPTSSPNASCTRAGNTASEAVATCATVTVSFTAVPPLILDGSPRTLPTGADEAEGPPSSSTSYGTISLIS